MEKRLFSGMPRFCPVCQKMENHVPKRSADQTIIAWVCANTDNHEEATIYGRKAWNSLTSNTSS